MALPSKYTPRELDISILSTMAGRLLEGDDLEAVLLSKAVEATASQLFYLTLHRDVTLYVDVGTGCIMVYGAEGEPKKLSELVLQILQDESYSLFEEEEENGEGED